MESRWREEVVPTVQLCVSVESLSELQALLSDIGFDLDVTVHLNSGEERSLAPFDATALSHNEILTAVSLGLAAVPGGKTSVNRGFYGTLSAEAASLFSIFSEKKAEVLALKGICSHFLEVSKQDLETSCVGMLTRLPRAVSDYTAEDMSSFERKSLAQERLRTWQSGKVPAADGSTGDAKLKKGRSLSVSLGAISVILVPIAISLLALTTNVFQAHQTADQTQIMSHGDKARLKLDTSLGRADSPDYKAEPVMTLLLTNIGKSAAVKVNLQCEPARYHGSYFQLGSIAVGDSAKTTFPMNEDTKNLARKGERLCYGTLYATYQDDAGEHHVRFDRQGDAEEVPASEVEGF